MSKTLLTAAWVAPMSGPVLRDAGVVFAGGRIVAVGAARTLLKAHADAIVQDLGNAIILPGLVNPHTHLELSNLHPGPKPARFVDWIIRLMGQTSGTTPQSVQDGVVAGITQCLGFGVTSVGDITSFAAITRAVLADSPLGGVSYGEVRAMAQRRGFLEERLDAAARPIIGNDRLRAGISPHAPYSIETTGYRRCVQVARSQQLPLATHLAETLDEAAFLANHDGPLRELWNLLGAWDDNVPRSRGGSIRTARDIGLLNGPTLLAHVNYADDEELDILAAGQASVVYCPRTHDYFDHPPHRWRDMLARGINVAVGTDSCASSPNLNIVDDLRVLHGLAPEVEPIKLWAMATVRAAMAIDTKSVGALAAGHFADMTVFAAGDHDPFREILESDLLPMQVFVSGRKI